MRRRDLQTEANRVNVNDIGKHAVSDTQGDTMKRPAKGGRPTSYRPAFAKVAFHMALLGATDQQLAAALDISERTLNVWKKSHPEFLHTLKRGKEHADSRVAASLYKRAVGYTHEDLDIRAVALGNNQGSKIVKTKFRRYYPPDVTSCIFWLKNRRPDVWRDRSEHTHANPDGSALGPTPAQLEQAALVADLLYQKNAMDVRRAGNGRAEMPIAIGAGE